MRLRRSREPGNDPWVEQGLETERLVLRRFTPADVGNLLALDGDPEVMRYLEPRVKTRAQIEAEVLPLFLGRHQPCPAFGRWAADARDSGDFVGWFGLRPVQPSDAAIVDWADAPPAAASRSSATACGAAPGAGATRPRERGRWCAGRSPSSASARSSPPR
jgi:RimJ/RimL family protein N-acetyltransferase